MLTPTLPFLTGVAANMIAGLLTSVKVGLFTNTPTLGRATVLSDLTQPTFTGYAEQAVTWGAAGEDNLGNIIYTGGLLTFQPSATTALPQTATGWYIEASIAMTETLLLAEYLPSPYTFNGTLDQLSLAPTFVTPNQNVWGDATVVGV